MFPSLLRRAIAKYFFQGDWGSKDPTIIVKAVQGQTGDLIEFRNAANFKQFGFSVWTSAFALGGPKYTPVNPDGSIVNNGVGIDLIASNRGNGDNFAYVTGGGVQGNTDGLRASSYICSINSGTTQRLQGDMGLTFSNCTGIRWANAAWNINPSSGLQDCLVGIFSDSSTQGWLKVTDGSLIYNGNFPTFDHRTGLGSLALGSVNQRGLKVPSGLGITNQGAAGSTTYGYRVSALDGRGETLAATEVTTTTGNATLSGSNFNRLTWTAVQDAVQYKIYGRTAGSELFIATVITPTVTYDDKGTVVTPVGALPSAPVGNRHITQKWASQTQNLAEWRDEADVVKAKIGPDFVLFPVQAATGSAPSYVEGGIYYDTTLHKLRVGGASGWETVTSA